MVAAFLRNLRKTISDTSRAWKRFKTSDTLRHLQELENTDAATALAAIKLQFTQLNTAKKRLEVLHKECGETERLVRFSLLSFMCYFTNFTDRIGSH